MVKRSDDGLRIRDQVAALKRERTIGAAVDLFYEKGYDRTTLDEVADRLGVTKPFIYANFGSKTELLAEICLRGVRAATDALDGALARRFDPRRTLEIFARDYVTAVLGAQKHIAVYVREEKNLESADARRIGDLRREFFRKITRVLELGAAAGQFAVGDPQMAALGIGGAVTWSTFWYRPDGRLSLAEISDAMAELILGFAGASPRPDAAPNRLARAGVK